MTADNNTPQPANAPKENKPPRSQKTPEVGIIMSPYIPYVIAGSFVVMTALLTFILTAIMDNKEELNRAIAQTPPQPILADARIAFGQEEPPISKEPDVPALLQEDIAVPPTSNKQDTMVQAEPAGEAVATTSESNNPAPAAAPVSNENTITEPVEASSASPAKKIALAATAATERVASIPATTEREVTIPSPATAESADNIPAGPDEETVPVMVASMTKPSSTVAINTAHTGKTASDEENHKSKADKNSATNTASPSEPSDESTTTESELVASAGNNLDKVVNSHETRISDIRAMITLRHNNKLQVEQAITYHMNLMEMQVRHIEDSIRPVYPQAIAAYERMINRRRETFHRRMKHRQELRQRIYESRNLLRQQYSQLLKLLWDENQSIA